MNLWTVMIAAGLITYAMRLSFIFLFNHFDVPAQIERALRYVPPAVMSAIFFPALVMPEGELWISFGNPRLLAGVFAILIAWRTRNAVLTIIVGMLALWILKAVL